MRVRSAALLLLALPLAGCADPVLAPLGLAPCRPQEAYRPGAAANIAPAAANATPLPVDDRGLFNVTRDPEAIVSAPGEAVRFTLDFAPRTNRTDVALNVSARNWVRLASGADVPPRGGRVDAEVLVGPEAEPSFGAVLTKNRKFVESYDVRGPNVSVVSWHSDVPIRTEICRGEAPQIPAGLALRAEGGSVTAVYALGHSSFDCGQGLTVLGNVTARVGVGSGRHQLMAFIATGSGDDCGGNPPYAPNPRLTVQAGPFPPGTVDVILFRATWVALAGALPGWDEARRSIQV